MIINFHYHLAEKESFLDELVKDMDEAGVDITNLMGGPEETFWETLNCGNASNDTVLSAVKKHPDRLVGNVYLDPRRTNAVETFQRYLDRGFRCVKMFPPVGFDPSDERFYPLYERIEQAGVPLLFHAGQTNVKIKSVSPGERKATDSRYSNPMNFDRISRLFPKMPIVLAHMGYPYYIDAWSVAHANPNVYLDISGQGPWTAGIPVVFNALGGHSFIPMDFKRVIWGNDNYPKQVEHLAMSNVFLNQMGATAADKELVFGATAKKLLRIGG